MTMLLEQEKGAYLLKPPMESLHHEVTEWLSELDFCKAELAFLSKVLDKYFLRVKGSQKLSDLFVMEKKVKAFRSNALKEIHHVVIHHEQHLAALDEDKFSQDEQAIREEHRKHSERMKTFLGSIRKIKKEIFSFVEKELKQAKKK